MRKPNSNSVLGTLPYSRKFAIAEYAAQPGHSLAKTVAWLAEDGIHTNTASLSEFLSSSFPLERQFQEDASTTESLLAQLRKDMPGLTEEQLDDLGQRTFSLLAIRRQDPEAFVMVRSARSKAILEKEKLALRRQAEARQQEMLKLEQNKYRDLVAEKMLDQALREQAERIANSDMSNADKIAAMRKAAFADVDALEATGEIVLPKRPT